MRNQPRNIRPTEALVDLLARRPELRDVGIAGYLAGAAVEGALGMPPKHTAVVFRGSEIVRSVVAA